MLLLIELLIVLVVLFIVGACALYIIDRFGLPREVRWVVGAILLVALLLYTAYLVQSGGPVIIKRGV